MATEPCYRGCSEAECECSRCVARAEYLDDAAELADRAEIPLCGCESEPHTCGEDEIDELHARLEAVTAERDRLLALINTPRTDDFFEAVRIESAHQIERWGTEHDAGKRPEDWIALAVYLLGKATRAHYEGDHDKLLHHVITVAAVCLNWHRNATGVSTAMRPGVGPTKEA